ncbi:ATP-dependent helicase [Staphylococcus condimenti]|uniref:DEAD-box ATP-dependent RNA helicase CshB n=1 Tax=Staphylococcus condimenti TaxID=70255 RepID=A0A143P999_9STAP|nr:MULTISPECIES: DEAD/DEAH box helicase [Staphylococcus]AMY04678.1 DEAD/DEAH box helicase [Staphylococcus condimenti]APR60917.1 DEAD/DEAH box helicase [Staphylococcus condimenti]MDK8644632.1 DEAD/DEAH box helicase [Staphylococcus condimenti]OFO99060.1 DEAD/DEAH box helicase [Staphylococcus sp. HMSC065E08]PNZ60852.1 ATP-dependent helicase [Staphylococcus condimenti]
MAKQHPFEQFGLDSKLIDAVTDLNFNQPTEIQQRVIPKILKGTSIIGQSQTGTGKSHAFLLPLIERINSSIQEPQAIVVAPTRELAQQLFKAAQHLTEFKNDIKVSLFIGGTDFERDKQRCNVQPQLVIGTPTRINDLSKDGTLHAHLANYLVVDEADLMIDLGLIEDVDHIASRLEEDANIAVFSATIPKSLHPFLNKYLNQPELIEVNSKTQNKKNIDFYLIPTKGTAKVDKTKALIDILNPYLCIIFCNSRESADELAEELIADGLKIGMIHGGLSPRERKQQMKRIRNLDFQYVIASDLASRGIDIEGVSHVINFDVPKDIDFFTHRVGRTGRGQYKGEAFTLFAPDEEELIGEIEDRGYHFKDVDIKNGEIKPIKAHNTRKTRTKKDDHLTTQVKRKIKRGNKKKVKPGYKKKFKRELEDLKRKERKQYSKRKNREQRKNK